MNPLNCADVVLNKRSLTEEYKCLTLSINLALKLLVIRTSNEECLFIMQFRNIIKTFCKMSKSSLYFRVNYIHSHKCVFETDHNYHEVKFILNCCFEELKECLNILKNNLPSITMIGRLTINSSNTNSSLPETSFNISNDSSVQLNTTIEELKSRVSQSFPIIYGDIQRLDIHKHPQLSPIEEQPLKESSKVENIEYLTRTSLSEFSYNFDSLLNEIKQKIYENTSSCGFDETTVKLSSQSGRTDSTNSIKKCFLMQQTPPSNSPEDEPYCESYAEFSKGLTDLQHSSKERLKSIAENSIDRRENSCEVALISLHYREDTPKTFFNQTFRETSLTESIVHPLHSRYSNESIICTTLNSAETGQDSPDIQFDEISTRLLGTQKKKPRVYQRTNHRFSNFSSSGTKSQISERHSENGSQTWYIDRTGDTLCSYMYLNQPATPRKTVSEYFKAARTPRFLENYEAMKKEGKIYKPDENAIAQPKKAEKFISRLSMEELKNKCLSRKNLPKKKREQWEKFVRREKRRLERQKTSESRKFEAFKASFLRSHPYLNESITSELGYEVVKRKTDSIWNIHNGSSYIGSLPNSPSFHSEVLQFSSHDLYKETIEKRTLMLVNPPTSLIISHHESESLLPEMVKSPNEVLNLSPPRVVAPDNYPKVRRPIVKDITDQSYNDCLNESLNSIHYRFDTPDRYFIPTFGQTNPIEIVVHAEDSSNSYYY